MLILAFFIEFLGYIKIPANIKIYKLQKLNNIDLNYYCICKLSLVFAYRKIVINIIYNVNDADSIY